MHGSLHAQLYQHICLEIENIEIWDITSDVCRGCALGQYTKTIFMSSDSKTAGFLDLIHSDLCGPMSVVSLKGYVYYM